MRLLVALMIAGGLAGCASGSKNLASSEGKPLSLKEVDRASAAYEGTLVRSETYEDEAMDADEIMFLDEQFLEKSKSLSPAQLHDYLHTNSSSGAGHRLRNSGWMAIDSK